MDSVFILRVQEAFTGVRHLSLSRPHIREPVFNAHRTLFNLPPSFPVIFLARREYHLFSFPSLSSLLLPFPLYSLLLPFLFSSSLPLLEIPLPFPFSFLSPRLLPLFSFLLPFSLSFKDLSPLHPSPWHPPPTSPICGGPYGYSAARERGRREGHGEGCMGEWERGEERLRGRRYE